MGKHNIEKKSIGYRLLYAFGVWIHDLIYREVYTINRPSTKNKIPAIITPNHQNALMDALAILYAKNEPLVFLARSDIFKKKSVAAILYFLKILPAYRIRDGFDSLKNNQETFDHTVRVLQKKRNLVVLPEGNHFGAKKLRALKKGFARIAFMTEINGNETVNLQIMPASIDYSSYDSFFSRLTVVFGKPFPIAPYLDEYKQNPQIALNKITQHLSNELKNLIIHIENEEFHNECVAATAIFAESKHSDYIKRYEYQRNAAQSINNLEETNPDKFNNLIDFTKQLKQIAGKIPDEIIGKNTGSYSIIQFIISLLITPLALPGTLLYGVFWYWPVWLTNKKIKDVQFRTSVRYVLYMIQFLLLLIVFFIVSVSIVPFVQGLIVFLLTIVSGILSVKIWRVFYWNLLKTKWYLISRRHKKTLQLREEIIGMVDESIKK